MFKLMGFVIKSALVTLLILVMGQLIRWNGKSISDQVKSNLAKAQRSTLVRETVKDAVSGATKTVRNVANDIADNVAIGAAKTKFEMNEAQDAATGGAPKTNDAKDPGREIAPTERQKLRALIQELNHSQYGHFQSSPSRNE